jgi:hypothetical protein
LAPNLTANLAAVSDVFWIYNNFFDSAADTGLGFVAFLFSGNIHTLPSPSTYRANQVEIREQPIGATQYIGNGTDYHLQTAVTPDHGDGKLTAPRKNSLLDIDSGPVAAATTYQSAIGLGPPQSLFPEHERNRRCAKNRHRC